MIVKFRQGVIRPYYSGVLPGDPSIPTYLRKKGASVEIRASLKDIIIVNFSKGPRNFLYEETENKVAWKNFVGSPPYWLYWDLTNTGTVEYGYTRLEPQKGGTLPIAPQHDQHFYLIPERKMKVWDSTRRRWLTKTRVFATRYDNAFSPEITSDFLENRSQVGLNMEDSAGYLLFSDANEAIRDSRGFITTETPLLAQGSSFNGNKVDAEKIGGLATQNIPRNYCVIWNGRNREIGLASYRKSKAPAVGVSLVGGIRGQFIPFMTQGYIHDPTNFAWSESPNTPLFVGVDGELTTETPKKISLQKVGYIVDKYTVYIDISPQILIDPVTTTTPEPAVPEE